MTAETFEKARVYGLDKAEYGFFKSLLCDIFISSAELYCGLMAHIWASSRRYTSQMGMNSSNEIIVSCVFLVVVNLLGVLKEMPFAIYSTFVLEERHGFNKQTPAFFIKDQIKAFFIGQIITIPSMKYFHKCLYAILIDSFPFSRFCNYLHCSNRWGIFLHILVLVCWSCFFVANHILSRYIKYGYLFS